MKKKLQTMTRNGTEYKILEKNARKKIQQAKYRWLYAKCAETSHVCIRR